MKLKEEIRNILSEENMACIFVTHDIDDVFGNADKLAVLKTGKIVQIGKPQNVYLTPRSKYVAEITGQINRHPAGDFGIVGTFFYTRPQHLKIHTYGAFTAKVVEVIYRGIFWEIILEKNGVIFSVYQMEPVEIGSLVKFDIQRYSSF
jgi:ABC-type sulfate/molybdate transport systems ATPase subunit